MQKSRLKRRSYALSLLSTSATWHHIACPSRHHSPPPLPPTPAPRPHFSVVPIIPTPSVDNLTARHGRWLHSVVHHGHARICCWAPSLAVRLLSKEVIGHFWDILNAVLGHRSHQNHSNRLISSEWSQHLQQKWLWLQSVNVNGRGLSTRSIVLPIPALGKRARSLRN